MHIKDLRAMSNEALKSRLEQLKIDSAIEKRKIAQTGVSSKKIKMREMRRVRAQILTLMNERGVKA